MPTDDAQEGVTPELVPMDEAQLMSQIGVTGLDRQGGYIFEEFLPALQGDKGVKVYKEMRDNSGLLGSILFSVDMMIRQVDWEVERASDSPQHKADAEFLESCMEDMSMTWPDVISEVLSMLPFGWSYLELVYKMRKGPDQQDPKLRSKYNDGKIGWRKLPLRAQETLLEWEFDDNDGSVIGMWQSAPPKYEKVFIPLEKALLFRPTQHKANPEGRSIFRNSYQSWYFMKHIMQIEAIGIERDLAGLPVMYVDPRILKADATDEEKALLQSLKRIVTNVRRDRQEGLILPASKDQDGNDLFKFELLSAPGARQFDTNGIIQRYREDIAMTVLADFILLGHESVGSFALASSKTSLFALAIGAWLDTIAAVFNTYAVPRLFKANGMKVDELPQIKHGDIETPDLGELGNFLVAMSNAGVPLNPADTQLMAFLRRISGMPEPTEGLEELAPPAPEEGLPTPPPVKGVTPPAYPPTPAGAGASNGAG